MKNMKKCPKCGNNDIVKINNGERNAVFTGSAILSAVALDTYICLGCGYTEEWIDEGYFYKLRNSKKAKPVE